MAELELEVISTADSRGLTQAARDTDKLRGATDSLGKEFNDTAQDSKELDARIKTLRQSVKALGAEFAKTEGPSLRKDLRSERSLLSELQKIREELDSGGGGLGVTLGSAAGTRAGQGFSDGFTRVLGGLPFRQKAIAALVGIGVALSPALGAIIAAAVTGAAGLGGIAGGIATAAKDSRVKAAAKSFSAAISEEFFGTSAFVQPTIQALDILKEGFKDLDLGGAFAEVSTVVDDVARGLVGLGKEFVPRFRQALIAARPVLMQLAKELPRLGASLGEFFKILAESPGAIAGMHAAFNLLNNAIVGTAQLIDFLGKSFVKLIDIGIEVSGFLEDIPWPLNPFPGINWKNVNNDLEAFKAELEATGAATDNFGGMMEKSVPDMAQFSNQLDAARQNTDALNLSLQELFGEQLSLADAQIGYQQALDDLTLSIQENGKEWDISTEKGRNNRRALLDVVKAAMDVRDAQAEAEGGTAGANAEYQRAIEKLEKMRVKLGLTKTDLENLVGKYEITFVIKTQGRAPHFASTKFSMFQGGGVTPAFEPFQVHAGELLWSNKQHYVSTKAQTDRLASMGTASRGTAGRDSSSTPSVHFSGNLSDPLADVFMKLFRAGKITVSTGRNN